MRQTERQYGSEKRYKEPLRAIAGENGGNSAKKSKEVSRGKRAESVTKEVSIQMAVAAFCLLFAEAVLQTVSRRAREKGRNIIRPILDTHLDSADSVCLYG